MSEKTNIAWTDHTFNPWWGCTEISPGCTNCYARSYAAFRGSPNLWGAEYPRRFFGDKHWQEPLKWDAKAAADGVRRRVFCASMCDVFEDREEYDSSRQRLFELIDATKNLDWLLLTKRPENMATMAPKSWAASWPSNVWALATVESQKYVEPRISALLKIPAIVRGISCEPLLGPLEMQWYPKVCPHCGRATEGHAHGLRENPNDEPFSWYCCRRSCGDQLPMPSIDWVILGCETGVRRRPCDPVHLASLVEQCRMAGVPFFVKQIEINGRIETDPAKWPEYLRVQEFPF